MQFTPAQEKMLRQVIVDLVGSVGEFLPFADVPLITSKQDFVDKFFVEETQQAEGAVVKYALVQFRRFTDTEDGCADNPVILVDYTVHAFVETYGLTGSGVDNSNNELLAFVLNLRNELLQNPSVTLPDASEHSLNPAFQETDIISDNDPVTGLSGTYVDIRVQAEIRQ